MNSVLKIGLVILILMLVFASGFFVSREVYSLSQTATTDPCSGALLQSELQALNNTLRAFDEATLISFGLPRSQVFVPLSQLQSYRLDLANQDTPQCLSSLKTEMLYYMDSVVTSLTAFFNGKSSPDIQAKLADAKEIRLALEADLGEYLGATLTPNPTSIALALVPEAGTIIDTPPEDISTSSPTPIRIQATVTLAQGVNLRLGPSLDYTFKHVLGENSVIQLIGRNEAADWVYTSIPDIEEGGGWLYVPLLSIDGDVEILPVIEFETE